MDNAELSDGSERIDHDATTWTLSQLARRFALQLPAAVDSELTVQGVCSLASGRPGCLAYAGDRGQRQALRETSAAVVIVPADLAADAPVPALVASQPKLVFARIAALFEHQPRATGIHSAAVVHADASIGAGVTIGAHAVVGADSMIGAGTRIGANSVIGERVVIGEQGLIHANVTINDGVRIGARVCLEAGAVIGARGFGLVHNDRGWEQIPQLGSVVLGDDVEVGATSCIDRGALDDTRISNDVRIDNHVQIGHNCQIGAHTVIAGSAGIGGSCDIGSNCMLGGAVGVGDHIRIVDNVIITGASQVSADITEPGVWSSTFRTMPAAQWRKLLARFRRLGKMEQRLQRLERPQRQEQQDKNQ